jgi:exonuclease SbcC
MNPTRIVAKGILSLRDVDLDLTALPDDALVAVAGANGAGKTTLLEAMTGGALYRRLPSRSSLLDAATSKASRLVVDFDHRGSSYRATHLLDPEAGGGRGKAEAYLECDGAPLTTGRARDFDEVVARLLPSPAVFFASAYAAQGGAGSFASLDVSGRRALFAELLGLADLQRLSDAAAERRKAAQVEAAVAEDALRVAAEDLAALPTREAELDAAVEAERVARVSVATLTQRRADLDQAAELGRQVAAEHAQNNGAQQAEASTRKTLDGLRTRLQRADEQAETLPALEERQASIDALTREREELVGEWQALAARRAPALARLDAAEGRIQCAMKELVTRFGVSADESTAETTQARDRRREELAAAVESARVEALDLTSLSDRLWAVDDKLAQATQREREARGNLDRARAAGERVAGFPCGGRTLQAEDGERVDCSTCPVVRGDLGFDLEVLASRAAEARSVVEAVTAKRARLEADLIATRKRVARFDQVSGEAQVDVNRLDRLVAQLAERDAAKQARDAALVEVEALPPEGNIVERGRAIREQIDALSAGHRAALDGARLAAAERETLRAAIRQAEEVLVERVATSAAVTERLRLAVEAFARRVETLAGPQDYADAMYLEAIRWPEIERSRVDVALAAATRTAQDAARAVGRADAAVARLRDLLAAHSAREQRAATAGLEVGAAALLARGLGPEGLQAVRVDAAGPEVGDLATELLSACYGQRFAVELRTLREGSGARKDRETLDLVVHDARGGRPRVFGDLSGGEQVVVDEALRLAIAVYRARRTPGLETLWRDEADGRLDPERAAAYPEMLRAAMALGRFRRCYFVSHRPEVAAQADARIAVADGTARIEL